MKFKNGVSVDRMLTGYTLEVCFVKFTLKNIPEFQQIFFRQLTTFFERKVARQILGLCKHEPACVSIETKVNMKLFVYKKLDQSLNKNSLQNLILKIRGSRKKYHVNSRENCGKTIFSELTYPALFQTYLGNSEPIFFFLQKKKPFHRFFVHSIFF
jgi:hypothetical protein